MANLEQASISQSVNFNSHFLTIEVCGENLVLSIERALQHHFNLRYHSHYVERLIEKKLAFLSVGPRSRVPLFNFRIPITIDEQARLIQRLSSLDHSLLELVNRPIGPTLVEKALSITAQERQHWSKEGRLPKSGKGFIKRGQLVAFATYSAEKVDELLQNPTIIARWREEDAIVENDNAEGRV